MDSATTPAEPAPRPATPSKPSDKVQIGPLDVKGAIRFSMQRIVKPLLRNRYVQECVK